jgi:hypothetical protein
MILPRVRFWLAAALLLLTILEFGSAQAAEVRCAANGRYRLNDSLEQKEQFARRWPSGVRPTGRTCATGVILGPIENGDYEKVRAFYRLNHPFLEMFDLASPGGNVVEAIKIGRLFRKYLISVEAPVRIPGGGDYFAGRPGDEKECEIDDCLHRNCASACALIWFGGVDRYGSVGLHRPRTTDPYFRALDPNDGAATYRKVLDSIQAYMDEMEVPKPVIELMTATGSANIRWVTTHQDDDLARPPSLAEWEDATCGSFSTDGHDRLQKNLMILARIPCKNELLSSRRDKLPLP